MNLLNQKASTLYAGALTAVRASGINRQWTVVILRKKPGYAKFHVLLVEALPDGQFRVFEYDDHCSVRFDSICAREIRRDGSWEWIRPSAPFTTPQHEVLYAEDLSLLYRQNKSHALLTFLKR